MSAVLQALAALVIGVFKLVSWTFSEHEKSKKRKQTRYRVMECHYVDAPRGHPTPRRAKYVDCGHSHESIAAAFSCRQTELADIQAVDETGRVRDFDSTEFQEYRRELKKWRAQRELKKHMERPPVRPPRASLALRAGKLDATEAKYRVAVDEFSTQMERHRARTLGRESEWATARASLTEAVDGARASTAYWRARLGEDPGNQMFTGQLKTATQLHAKLRSALDKLDGRADVLRKFYDDCEARIAVMDRYNRDIEEMRRLERLSGSVDTVITGAETALGGIGASFLREARQVGEVIGAFERLQLKSLVGEAPLDDIEFLADRINESSERQFDTVEQLRQTIEAFAEPTGSS